jgi:transcriptional regulator with XRE-family HTH domain
MAEDSAGADPVFARRLNDLFASIRPGDGREEYSNGEIGRRAGVSGAYIGQLRNGRKGPPSKLVAQEIEKAFGLEETYLLSDDPADVRVIDEQLVQLRELHARGVWRLAMRAGQVRTAEGLALLEAALEHVLELERARSVEEEGEVPPR